MLRLCRITSRRCMRFYLRRTVSSPVSCSYSSTTRNIRETSQECPKVLKNSEHALPAPPPPHILGRLTPLSLPSSVSRTPVIALSAALISAIFASCALISTKTDDDSGLISGSIRSDLERAIDRSNESAKRIITRMKQTGVAAAVLWKSLRSVLSSANHEVRSGFEVRVAALLADIVAANQTRRAALVGAGGGAVLDWLLDTVVVAGDNPGVQAECARALAYLISDPSVSKNVLGRPHAVPNLLKFIFSAQPHQSKKQTRRSSFDVSDSLKGRSMLVAAIMDIVTSNCDNPDKRHLNPALPGNAEMRDIAAAIEVIEEGGLHMEEPRGNEEDGNGDEGIRGIGIKVLGGTTVLGLSQNSGLESPFTSYSDLVKHTSKTRLFKTIDDGNPAQLNLSSAVVPGLWDDLYSQHVAVPFAAWALANWAMASDVNRYHIRELDQNGHAVMTALGAPERSVKWHGSLVAQLLLEDRNLPIHDSVSDWSFSLLCTVSQASKTEDIPLAQMALSAVLLSMERSAGARKVVMEKGLHLMRETAKQTVKHKPLQEALAKVLELLCSGDLHLSLDESKKWAGILLPWVFGKLSSDVIQSSAIKILSCMLEDYGPSLVPISQGWLTLMLTDILDSRKTSANKGSTPPRSDKVKTQIDQSNMLSAAQTANQLAGSVVCLAAPQLGRTDSDDTFPLADLLSLEPFAGQFRNLKKDNKPKFNAANAALLTHKGIKALTEISYEDSFLLNKIIDLGILSLLRHFVLRDDYEKLAVIEAYDASMTMETREQVSTVFGESSVADTNDSSTVRSPPKSHIRRHALRLLTILSGIPKVQEMMIADETWCNWLEDCARGKISGCNELKIRSYARATLLNVFCNNGISINSSNDTGPDNSILNKNPTCPQFADMIFLINPELPHWKCPSKIEYNSNGRISSNKSGSLSTSSIIDYKTGNANDDSLETGAANDDSLETSIDGSESCSQSEGPPMDVVFVHGLRGGPFRTWRVSENKSSTKSGLVEKIDEEAGKQGTFWPGEWLSADFPHARIFSIKYKTNLTQWSGASLPLQEVSSMLLEKLLAAGIGDRPIVFVTHSMGGLVVKQMLHQAKAENKDSFVDNTIGLVFYSCPHFGSKLADMPWRMGLVFRPAPTIGELRSGSPRLVELNDYVRHLYKKRALEILNFCETKVTPIVEGYGGWAFRMEIVSIESAYPGFGELVVLESTDHVNSCKPLNRADPSYRETLEFLQKLKAHMT